jgi:hypothetical protein
MRILTDVDYDDVVTVTKERKRKNNVPAYDCFGGNMDYSTKVKGYPKLYKVIQGMSKQTAWLWWELVARRNRNTNISIYRAESPADKRRLTTAYKTLHELDLIKRVRRQHYMINPAAYLPAFDKFNTLQETWRSL